MFDQAIYAARLSDARAALGSLEQLAEQIVSELGQQHPYLGLVLLTLASATCALAAVDGNIQDLRRYADVLAVAVQRASTQLGPEHVQTIGGMANLAHAEFEIALASRTPTEVSHCLENFRWVEEHSGRVCGGDHPTVVILAMNTAVAALECARQARSVERATGGRGRAPECRAPGGGTVRAVPPVHRDRPVERGISRLRRGTRRAIPARPRAHGRGPG